MDNGYPRSVVHPDIRLLSSAILALIRDVDSTQSSLLLFSGPQAALSCKQYILLLSHGKGQSDLAESILVYSVDFIASLCHDHARPSDPVLYAMVYPSMLSPYAIAFWQRAGPGVSSRLAQNCLERASRPRIHPWTAPPDTVIHKASGDPHPVYQAIRSRISGYVQGFINEPRVTKQVVPSDVFLYGSGMTAVYHVHQSILSWRAGESVSAGLLYEPTYKVLETHGPGLKSYNLGPDANLDHLAAYLELESKDAPTVQSIWCECPSNPLMRTADLQRLRSLADQHDLLVVVDDSVASFANINLLGVADIIISSLSKYFSGYADVMAGSVILNPNSTHYGALHQHISSTYENGLFVQDAIQLESNSSDFLTRMAQINETTQYLVTQLLPLLSNPSSPLTNIFHPSVCSSRLYYERQMRPQSEGFRPGYGGVFTMQFADIASSSTFFDNLDVYKGLSFGADVCIASPYMQMTGQAGKKQTSADDISETIIRFSVGLEKAEQILRRINTALDAAVLAHRDKCHISN
ncbi:unnamed protein product [Penicillium salamii]|uniref:Cystathionine gamma-synthase n=1 Tax=Penicillium salamii TaxID=1612424 RepID=A0A9W4N5V2_9EURO|nr:unnamed protein product [Penicillium salamii]CAG7965185.1 unnamed protein product [Penicillium salamii]CAG7986336.1 unnamed protein product [Penicillium salamii]CAG8134493.1 unnamed protein product [Penicillium salamii]CAG8191242.1 unnamed protein product [Penicillium salamii]